ncbi:hypothetical protein THAOC_05799 [Thalassiosira oceanica]|uniref:Uncharacterized protein n=1 Tax=Thalassiosira oceanica TaxID=159749 RepID=K0TMF1_THAOC|nr:hypothetical protein THAOC_05799 [Thalassiosira oceanica]|eukprot:EJK72647.1 hypothetical protein THAOC_05799 [Thalassiosira oceanica]
MEGNINSMTVAGIDYRLLDSLYAPSTLRDPSAHRPPDARLAPARGISNTIEWSAIVRPRHCGPEGRSSAKHAGVVFELSSATRRLLKDDMLPTSTASLGRAVRIVRGHVVRPSDRSHRRSDRHWRRSSDMEPRRRPSELAEHPPSTRGCTGKCPTLPRPSLILGGGEDASSIAVIPWSAARQASPVGAQKILVV